ELARRGYAVAVNYAGNADAARQTQELIASLNGNARVFQADVGVTADRERLVDEGLAAWGRLDPLVNNAGLTSVGRKDVLEATEGGWDRVLAGKLKGPFFLAPRAAHQMIRLRDRLTDPAVINVTSLSAYALSVNRGDYCISKAGLSLATQLFAIRLAEHGIRVYEVRPGVIDTDMTAAAAEKYTKLISEGLMPIRRWGTPEDVAKAVAGLATGAI